MFVIKNFFGEKNYHAYEAIDYFVDYVPDENPAAMVPEGASYDFNAAVSDVPLPGDALVYPRIAMRLDEGENYRIIDVPRCAYIENERGKTVDVVRYG